ncbi:MAG: HupE/UreJ family protein, partial [Alphaproteobacteria bacterium]
EGRPLLIKLSQQADGLALRWQAPPILPQGAEPMVRLEGCSLLVDASRLAPTHSLIGETQYDCPNGWANATAQIIWPSINPALATLVEVSGGQTRFFGPEQTRIPLSDFEGAGTDLRSFILTGIEHILAGVDHLLFVLALTLIVWRRNGVAQAERLKRLGWMVTGFTLAHSLTLGLATLGLIRLPAPPVEAAIALSILFVCVELARNHQETITWRYPAATASAFGLLHGLGFATVLMDAGLPPAQQWLGLLGFNLGVEIGQLVFVALAVALGLVLARILPADGLKRGTSVLIYGMGSVSAFWMFERFMTF